MHYILNQHLAETTITRSNAEIVRLQNSIDGR